jgi:hypothetical protein
MIVSYFGRCRIIPLHYNSYLVFLLFRDFLEARRCRLGLERGCPLRPRKKNKTLSAHNIHVKYLLWAL